MSVIYKALSTIEAAEGVRHVWPGAAELAAARRREGRHGSKFLLVVAVLSGLCVIVIVVTGQQSLLAGIGDLAGTTKAAFSSTATAAGSDGNQGAALHTLEQSFAGTPPAARGAHATHDLGGMPQRSGSQVPPSSHPLQRVEPAAAHEPVSVVHPDMPVVSDTKPDSETTLLGATDRRSQGTVPVPVARPAVALPPGPTSVSLANPADVTVAQQANYNVPGRVVSSPAAAVAASPLPVKYVFEPASLPRDMRSGAANMYFPGADVEPAANRVRRAVRKPPHAAPPDDTVSRSATSWTSAGPASSARRSTNHGFVTVTADHTQHIQLLNVDLSRAIARDDKPEVDHILEQLQALVGDDSTYMLKVRAFTQLALGGNDEYAMSLLRQVLARDPDDREAALNMAVAEINLGQISEARQRLRALTSVYPGDSQVDQLLRLVR